MKTHYAGFGPTLALAMEALQDRSSIHAGRETLRRWKIAEGVWLSRKQHETFTSYHLVRKLMPGGGHVERATRTLRDQLVQELRLAGISGLKAGYAFCPRS